MDVREVVGKDKTVQRVAKKLAEHEKERDAIRGEIAEAGGRASELRAEIARVEREGDLKADVVALHRELDEATQAIEDAQRRLRPVQGAVEAQGKVLAAAKREAIEAHVLGTLHPAARAAEDRFAAGVGQIERALGEAAATLGDYSAARSEWSHNGGDRSAYHMDLLSFERVEIDRFKQMCSELRVQLQRVFSRGGRKGENAA